MGEEEQADGGAAAAGAAGGAAVGGVAPHCVMSQEDVRLLGEDLHIQ